MKESQNVIQIRIKDLSKEFFNVYKNEYKIHPINQNQRPNSYHFIHIIHKYKIMYHSHDSNTLLERVHNSKLENSEFKCEGGNKITQFCENKQCRFQALSCCNEDCNTCLLQHEDCSFKSIAQLIKKWERRTNIQKDVGNKLLEIEKEALSKFLKSQQKFMESIVLGKYEPHSAVLRGIQMRSGNSGKCGKEMCQIFTSLCKQQKLDVDELIKTYRDEVSKVMLTLESQRQAAFHDLFRDQNASQLEHFNHRPNKRIKMDADVAIQPGLIAGQLEKADDDPCNQEKRKIESGVGINAQKGPKNQPNENQRQQLQEQHVTLEMDDNEDHEPSQQLQKLPHPSTYSPIIDSNILNSDARDKSKIDFLLQQLNHPKSLKLLFRASEHSFKAAKFHQFCDGVSDTVTIVQTSFKRIVAGWTKIKFEDINYWLEADEGQAFLLQLDLKEKYELKKKYRKTALYYHMKFGPCFGSDLVISDQCDYNFESRTSFPHSYNSPIKDYPRNQKRSKAILCGCYADGRFRVLEYEVFQVIR